VRCAAAGPSQRGQIVDNGRRSVACEEVGHRAILLGLSMKQRQAAHELTQDTRRIAAAKPSAGPGHGH